MIYIPFIKEVMWICVFTKNNKVYLLFIVYIVSEHVSRPRYMIIFFVSMAYHFSEQASHLVSRESVAALIPDEKPAKLPESLSQNAPGSARICVGSNILVLA
jgi:hypothetical protein